MGSVITVMNMKGGVGKTTISMHLGGLLSRENFAGKQRSVLLIDYDPQFNLSQAFFESQDYFKLDKERKTSLAILQDNESDVNPYAIKIPSEESPPKANQLVHNLYKKEKGSLSIIPASLDLMYLAVGQHPDRIAPLEKRFKTFIHDCKNSYDVIIIDCHPAGSIFTKTSIENSEYVLVPVVPDQYAARGVGLMMKFIESSNKKPRPFILFNKTQKMLSSYERDIRGDVHVTNQCLSASLRTYKAFSNPKEGKGFVWDSNFPHKNQALQNLRAVVTDVVTKLSL